MHEATIHVRGGSPYAAATADSDATVELWCNDHCDLLLVRGSDADDVAADVAESVGVRDVLDRGHERVVVTESCLRPLPDDTIEPYLERHDCLHVPPLRYADGGRRLRVLALDADDLAGFYADVADAFDVEVRSKRDLATVDATAAGGRRDPLADLTARQREALLSAWRAGYYAIPRGSSTAALADEMGVDRRTFEEHLRLAEQRVVDGLLADRYGAPDR